MNTKTEWHNLIKEVCASVSKLTGNIMSENQWPMVESRLRRRFLELKLTSPQEYREYWKKNLTTENTRLISILTTHFTSFFREFPHFEWIAKELPHIVATAKKEGRKTIKFWSAASSKGQEVWSLCMWLDFHLQQIDSKIDWVVYGSDIDPESVKEGENAVYHRRELESAPRHLWEHHWIRGRDEISDWYKVKSSLKGHAKFQTMNLLNPTMPVSEKFDLIMCRNVLIYFDRHNQEKITLSLLKYLIPGGTLITGMSESLNGFGFPIKGVSASVYKKLDAPQYELSANLKEKPSSLPLPLKVLCIDDSPTVLSILKKILQPPEFQVIGIANNGAEAIEKLKELKPDIITLDLHMPIMDGLEFLKVSGIAKDLPVVVVSSVGRDHDPLMKPLHEQGVTDFVEKPTLSNMNVMGEELTKKLKMAHSVKKLSGPRPVKFQNSFKQRPPGHIAFNFSSMDKTNLINVLSRQRWAGDELSFLIKGSNSEIDQLKQTISLYIKDAKKVNYLPSSLGKGSSRISLCFHFSGGDTQTLKLCKGDNPFIVLEENSMLDEELKLSANEISPITSFSYLADKFLGGE